MIGQALPSPRRMWTGCLSAGWLGLLLAALAVHAQYVPYIFDENQYVAAGAALARQGLWPFFDYPYFHLPNLVLVYAGVYLFTDDLLTAGRLVSAAGAWVCLAVVFAGVLGVTRAWAAPLRVACAAAATLLLWATPQFVLTVGKAWNQDPALAAAMLALVALWRAAASRRHPGVWGLACGAMLGMAIGTRVTMAPLLAGFLVLVPLVPRGKDVRLQIMGGLLGGGAVLLLPTILAWVARPEAFWFGVLEYPLLNVLAERADPVMAKVMPPSARAVTLADKPAMIAGSLQHPATLILLVAFGALGLPAAAWAWMRGGTGSFKLRSSLVVAVLITAGAVSPLPMFGHYVYPALPPLLLTAVLGAGWLGRRLPRACGRGPVTAMAACVVVGAMLAVPRLVVLGQAVTRGQATVPQRLARQASELDAVPQARRVLTLSPLHAALAGRAFHEDVLAGPLPFRVGPWIATSRVAELELLVPRNLDTAMMHAPPQAILTGVTVMPYWEESLVSYAKEQLFTPMPLGDRRVLWLSPTLTRGADARR